MSSSQKTSTNKTGLSIEILSPNQFIPTFFVGGGPLIFQFFHREYYTPNQPRCCHPGKAKAAPKPKASATKAKASPKVSASGKVAAKPKVAPQPAVPGPTAAKPKVPEKGPKKVKSKLGCVFFWKFCGDFF